MEHLRTEPEEGMDYYPEEPEPGGDSPDFNGEDEMDYGDASREEQHARYIDCGPMNWDDSPRCEGEEEL